MKSSFSNRMKKLIQLPRFPELMPLLVMNYVFDELTSGFERLGFEVRIVNRFEDLEDGGILFLDDSAYKKDRNILNRIAAVCPNSVCICWYWLDTSYRPFKYMIHTAGPSLIPQKGLPYSDMLIPYMQTPTFQPIFFRPDESLESIGLYQRVVVRDYCYMGAPYKPHWVPSSPEFTGIYHTGDWSTYLSYAKRKEIYLSSTFALGFHDDVATESLAISARVFEGLIYGCIVFSENKFACDYTDNIVVYISSKEDLESKMRYFLSNPEEIKKKQEEGYEWMKTKGGTNSHSCLLFLKKIKELYNIDI